MVFNAIGPYALPWLVPLSSEHALPYPVFENIRQRDNADSFDTPAGPPRLPAFLPACRHGASLRPVAPCDSTYCDAQTPEARHRIADIFRDEGEELLKNKKLTSQQAKAVYDIMNCRTEAFGYHADICGHCGLIELSYNSCRNRHCPTCQGIAKRRWLNARLGELLPINYHHVVFTVPSYISMLAMYNRRLVYDLLFHAASMTLLAFGRDPKFLGAEIGFYGILHTWSQLLMHHIHLHMIVTAGGLTDDGVWKEPKNAEKFLFPTRALSKVFRGKFIEGLKDLYYHDKLDIPECMAEIKTPEGFEKKLCQLASKSWRPYCKPPFSGPEEVVRYIGRYSHRIAITDGRILSYENNRVTFSYKDNKEKDPDKKNKEITLGSKEFVNRFLDHVLPLGYHRIRNYGFLSNGRKHQNIEKIKSHLSESIEIKTPEIENDLIRICPVCQKGAMKTFLVVNKYGLISKSEISLLRVEYTDTS